MKSTITKKMIGIVLVIFMVFQMAPAGNFIFADYDVASTDTIVGTFYNYQSRTVNNTQNLGLYCDWTTIDGGKPLNMVANGLDDGAYLHLTINLNAIRNGNHVNDFSLGGTYIKLRSVDNNGENNIGWANITLNEGTNQLDIPLYSNQADYAGTSYPSTSKTGNMDWTKLNRIIIVSPNAKNSYNTDTTVSMIISDACITCPTNKRDSSAFENVRIATPTLESSDKIVYSVNPVTDLGADNTGNTDCTAIIQSAIDSLAGTGGIVYLPEGRYKVTGTLTLSKGVTLRGEWKNPDNGGLGKGTILMAYSGAGNADGTPFISVTSGSCFRDISVWYPEQSATSPVAYPFTIHGHGHTSIYNITLYNSYQGFYNNTCSSMLIRGLYGTVLKYGIIGAYAYDVPRTEKVSFDTKYWANSGLSNAPSGASLTALNNYCENNLTGIFGGEQDWGYWYDLYVNHAKYACYLSATLDQYGAKVAPGNDAIGKLVTDNVDYGIYIHNTSYPGLEVSYCDIDANIAGIYYGPKPANNEYYGNEDGAVNAAYFNDSSVIITKSNFSGSGYGFLGENDYGETSGINFNDCNFESTNGISMLKGSLVCSNGHFTQPGTSIELQGTVKQAVLSGNTFTSANPIDYNDENTVLDMTNEKLVPNTPDYDYTFAPVKTPANNNLYNVEEYGAVAGVVDSTGAFQAALTAAGNAGGGTVYVPGGYYTLKGSLTVPQGVELRGSFDGAHYGNSTTNGTVLYVYANKNNENGAPFIDLAQNAGVRGFTMVYPEQGITDNPELDEPVHAYPPTIRFNKGSWARTCSINGTYTMMDAMTNVCDGFVIDDVTGCYMGNGLLLGHGTNGGYVQDFHCNYTSWPTSYLHVYQNNVPLTDYSTQYANWMTLGDFSNVKFFSDFTILISDGMTLIKDPYTNKCTQDMLTWGTAFDATGDGIVAKSGADSKVTLLSSMGVYNQHNPGYNVVTESGFNGTISIYNADVWSSQSRIVNVAGGTVNLIQYLSWCCYDGICHEGGTVNVYGSTIVGTYSGSNMVVDFEEGSTGTVAGNANNRGNFFVSLTNGANVDVKNNGIERDMTNDVAVEFNTYAVGNYMASNGILSTGWKALTPLQLANGSTQNHASLSGYDPNNLCMRLELTLDKGTNTASDATIFQDGNIQFRQAWSKNDGTDDALCYTLNDGYFEVASGDKVTLYMPMKDAIKNNPEFNWSGVKFINITLDVTGFDGIAMNVSDVRVLDTQVTEYWKYQLYKAISDGPDPESLDTTKYATYLELIDDANDALDNDSITMQELKDLIESVKEAQKGLPDLSRLDRTGWTATASNANNETYKALDGDITTRWTTYAIQEPGQWFILDIKEPQVFDTVELLLGTSTNDNPKGYKIYTSLDGVDWGTPVLTGNTKTENYEIGTQYARYIKIEQTGTSGGYWSIHEIYLKNTEEITPTGSNDAFVSRVMTQNSTVIDDEEITFSAMVRNTGDNYTGALKVEFYVDNRYLDSVIVPSIDAGSSKVVSTNKKWHAFWGTHSVKATVTEIGEVLDTDSTNNSLKQKFGVFDN